MTNGHPKLRETATGGEKVKRGLHQNPSIGEERTRSCIGLRRKRTGLWELFDKGNLVRPREKNKTSLSNYRGR